CVTMSPHLVNKDDLNKALETLKNGGLILYPTETIWGIGCDATNEAAVEKVFALKGREKTKSLIVLLHNDNQLASYVNDVPEVADQLIEYAEKPLASVYANAETRAKAAGAGDGSIGIRIARHPFCEELLQRFRKPIISPSANIRGDPSPTCFGDISPLVKG